MRIRTTKTKNGRLFYVIRTYYDTTGKEHSITVKKLGNENAIREKYNCDPDIWAKAYVSKLIYGRILEPCSKTATYEFSKEVDLRIYLRATHKAA